MTFRLSFRIDGLPKMANGSHGHWAAAAGERKRWKMLAAQQLVGRAPPLPFQRVRATFTRHSSNEPDDDGLAHGFKPIRDALVKFGFVVDDKRANLEAIYRWEHAPRGQGHVTVEVEELPQVI